MSIQEEFQTLGWILNQSEYGFYLIVADETMQQKIVKIYQQKSIKVYDYKQHKQTYTFQELKNWIDTTPEIQTFFIVNLQLAIQQQDDLKRLNFSRDMLNNLKKNLIFMTTSYGDDKLAKNAYDFYSFIKIRMIFCDDDKKENIPVEKIDNTNKEIWSPEKSKQKIKESYILFEKALSLRDKAQYAQCEELLLKALNIREKILGKEHLETATIYNALGIIYGKKGEYDKAELYYNKALKINEDVLGKEHPSTAENYNNLGTIYYTKGEYNKAEQYFMKALKINEEIFGREHPETAGSYNNLGKIYYEKGEYDKAEEYFMKALKINEEVLGKEYPNTIMSYNNLTILYKAKDEFDKTE